MILYASWIPKDIENSNPCHLKDLVRKYVSATAISELKKIQSKCQKKLTKAGKERKLRIIYAQEKLVLYMNTFKDVLLIFKSFVLHKYISCA